MKALIAYDGSLNSKTALRYGIQRMREVGGEIIVLHVFNSGMFIGYDATPGAEQTARRESDRYVEEAEGILKETGGGLRTRVIVQEGNPAEEILRFARSENPDIIFSPPGFRSIVRDSPCPVSVIPGHIIVPLDNTDVSEAAVGRIIQEVNATGSKVILLGIVPIHIYGRGERKEVEKVKKETSASLKKLKKTLHARGVETREIMRSGYPDEEIAKVAEEYSASMVVLPAEGREPSELSKAAAILSDREAGLTNKPIILVCSES